MTDTSRVRVTIIGIVCVAGFVALFARLWFLQVVSGESFEEIAVENSTTVIQTEMPRGRILDRNGEVLVDNGTVNAIVVDRSVGESELDLALGSLAELFGRYGVIDGAGAPVDLEQLRDRYEDPRASRFKPAVVATDLEPEILPDEVLVTIAERSEEFEHVSVVSLPVRRYPNGSLAAHVLGYTGEISAELLEELGEEGYREGDTVGRTGAEAAFESDLRGEPRRETVEVDPFNDRVSEDALEVEPGRSGNDVWLTIDADIQRAAEEALVEAIDQARTHQNPDVEETYETFDAPAGSVVVLDANDGSVVAMASYPTYRPELFIGGIPQVLWDYYNDEENFQPLNNRATSGEYAPGSSFKLITALAALEQQVRGISEPYDDPGVVEIENTEFRNAGGAVYGIVDLRTALSYSVDTYFYEIGRQLWICFNQQDTCEQDGEAIQQVARRLGFGADTGIALSEASGRVPDEDWKEAFVKVLYTDEAECAQFGGRTCEQLQTENEIWFPGDNVNLAIGQGDLVVTPLQLANAYAAFANGSTLWQPTLASKVTNGDGETLFEVQPQQIRDVRVSPVMRSAILDGLTGAITDEGGTAYEAFLGFPTDRVSLAGKTGTAQVDRKGDTSLFAAVVPAGNPEFVVVAVIEQAGNGSRVAAPVTRQVIEALYDLPRSELVVPSQEHSSAD